ncbi:SDR family oxidoreductase [Halovivax cerinus]|uniref:SDR family oxidoreductase n=1 Tax=Halovivax cerinus TaxID=1487865 RepID=A0ABD5NKY4_9EURY|nr:SDR family oxidoreductase [Halovivax cerinus]
MRVAILGCGYVGLELGRQLTQAGHEVVGVRRSDEGLATIEEAGFDAVRADVTDAASLSAVPDADAVVFTASSGGGDADAARTVYVDGLRTAIEHFGGRSRSPDRLVYTSSTGVHGDHDGDWVDSTTPIEPATEKAAVLAEAERIALERPPEYAIDGTVARLAGIYGPGRYRVDRYLEGPVTEGILNLVHRDDAAGAVRHLLTTDAGRGVVVQVVDEEPVARWELADWLATRCGRDPPPKRTKRERLAADDLTDRAERRLLTSKRCANDRLVSTGYEYTYPTFRDGYRDVVDDRDS